jgi:3-methyladenine DNA glycosylase AlkD
MPPTADQIAQALKAELAALPSQTAPNIRALRRRYSAFLASHPASLIRRIADRLLDRRVPCGRLVACELVAHHPAAFASLTPRHIRRLGRGMDSWSDVDCFAYCIAGPAWRHDLLTTAEIRSWARSTDRWWRRAALVATVPLNVKSQGGRGDPARTLAICNLLVRDRDPMIVKALSWALRALAPRHPNQVAAFLRRHKDNIAPLVLREVTSKLTTGHKSRRRSSLL